MMRGYLLIEAMFAGVVIGVALFAALAFVSQARTETKAAGNRAAAMQLARGQAERVAAGLPTVAPSSGLAPVEDMSGFSMSVTTSTAALAGVTTLDARDIDVTVEYPSARGSREDNAHPPSGDGRASVRVHRQWVDDP